MQLYKIAHEYEQALTTMQEDESLTPEIIEDSLAVIKDDFDTKVINISYAIKNLEAEANAIREAERNMSARRRTIEKHYKNIENYLLTNMENCEISEIKCPHFAVKVKKCPPSIKILDETKLKAKYIRTKIEKSPDKTKMKMDLQNGILIEGAELIQKNRLEIK